MSTKITQRPLNKGAPRFPSMQSQTQTEEGYIRRLVGAGTAGGFHLKAEKALTYLETTYHVFFTSPLYTFNEDM